MKAASVKLVLRESKIKKDGTAPIWIRVTANRKSRFMATGIYIEPKYWNDRKQKVSTSHELASSYNARLTQFLIDTRSEALDAPNADAVKESLQGGSGTFTAYFERFIDGLNSADRFWEWKKYRVTLGKLKACLGNTIDWADLNKSALITFERHLREKNGNGPNTVRKELGRLHRVIRQAVREGVIKPDANPFLVYDRPKAKQPNRRKLTHEEIQLLAALDLKAGSSLALSRDAFLLAFYGGGTRFGDICRLRSASIVDGRLEYAMLKTGTLVSVPLPPPALEIAQRYDRGEDGFLFPFLDGVDESHPVKLRRRISSRNVVVNRDLKKLAELGGLEPDGLSFHVARHSYADFARKKSGNLYALMKTLGHQNLHITQAYLRSFDRDAVDELAEELWGTS